jgi:hypothetical protein
MQSKESGLVETAASGCSSLFPSVRRFVGFVAIQEDVQKQIKTKEDFKV